MDYGVVRTDRGLRCEVAREVAAPATAVWEVLTDVTRWTDWGPPVTGVEYPERTVSPGTGGRVQTFGVVWVPFRVETVREFCWTWTVRGFTPPADGHRVEDLGDGRSRVVLELPLWAPWYVVTCWLALRNVAGIVE